MGYGRKWRGLSIELEVSTAKDTGDSELNLRTRLVAARGIKHVLAGSRKEEDGRRSIRPPDSSNGRIS